MLVLFIVVAVGVPVVGAISWSITDAYVLPEYSQKGGESVVFAHVVDHNGILVTPNRCEDINNLYDYAGDVNMPLTHSEDPEAWFYDEFTTSETDSSLTIYAGGECEGVDTTESDTDQVSLQPDGDLKVEFLTDMSGGFWEEETVTVRWNVTRTVQFGTAFEPGANLSYKLYRPNLSVVQEGELGGFSDEVVRGDSEYFAEITFPRSSGQYILSVIAVNESLNLENPYGGAAQQLWVRPTYLRGDSQLIIPDENCVTVDGREKCEKGAQMEVTFREDHANADNVTVTVTDTEGFSATTFTQFTLNRWNESYWNQTFTVPRDFDTATYGHALAFQIFALHEFTRNDEVERSAVTRTEYVNISRFKIIESTPPFIRLGDMIDLIFSPVTPYTENPVSRYNISRVNIQVRNMHGQNIYENVLFPPFDDVYDDSRQVFTDPFTVPFNTTTGVHTVHVTIEDVFGEAVTEVFDFKVMTQEDTARPVVLVGAGGQVNNEEMTANYSSTGTERERVILKNLGDSPALVDVFFTGDMQDIARFRVEETPSIAPGQQHIFEIPISISESGRYTGDIIFQIGGSFIEPYNITVPADIFVQCKDIFDVFCVVSTDLEKTITSPGTHAISFRVLNQGSSHDSFSVRAEGNITDLVGFDSRHRSVNVGPGNVTTVELPFNVGVYNSGFYPGRILLSTHPEGLVMNASILAQITESRITVDSPDRNLGQYVDGESVTLSLIINNTGTQTINSLEVSSPELGISRTESETLEPRQSMQREYQGTARAGLSIVNVTVTPEQGSSDTAQFTIRTYRDYQGDIQQLRSQLSRARATLGNATRINESTRTDIGNRLHSAETLLNRAESSWNGGQYQAAADRFQEADDVWSSTAPRVSSLESETDSTGGGFSLDALVIPMAIILIIFAISGVILYLSVVPEEE